MRRLTKNYYDNRHRYINPPVRLITYKRIFLFVSIIALLNSKAMAYSQGLTLSFKDSPLSSIFKEIERQSKFEFIYPSSDLHYKRISISVVNAKIQEVMDKCLADLPYTYYINGNRIVVSKERQAEQKNKGIFPDSLIDVQGKVLNEKNEVVAGATIRVSGTDQGTSTNDKGEFSLLRIRRNVSLMISNIGYQPRIIKVRSSGVINIQLTVSAQAIKEIVVTGSTGYQVINKNHPGSFDVVDNTLLNRRVSSDILSRIENLTSGVSFRNPIDGLLIRGRNSIFSNVSPLIIFDNFPYDGDINNINPSDIESITILKDAAAASQWGARAGNGVIVITSKKGKTGKLQIELNSNFTFEQKEDLHRLPRISVSDYIDLERWLFDQGYYNTQINNTFTRPPLTPVVEVLVKKRAGILSKEEADAQIQQLGENDALTDLEQYFYQKPLATQNAVNFSGNSPTVNYYMSVGWDNSISSLKGAHNDRLTLKSQNTFRITKGLDIEGGVLFTKTNNNSGNNQGINGINSGGSTGLYPYANLVDPNGAALGIVRNFRNGYTDTAGGGELLDWKYKPLNEIGNSKFNTAARDILVNTSIRFQVNTRFRIDVLYRYENASRNSSSEQKVEAFAVRDLINRFYQPNAIKKFPVPIGGILNNTTSDLNSHQGRVQLNYNQTWRLKHDVAVIAGWEIKDIKTKNNSYTIYGYNQEGNQLNNMMDFSTEFPQFNAPSMRARIPNQQSTQELIDRFISKYANVLYTYDSRYNLSLSARNDAANLFGAGTNSNSVPLWSVGVGYLVNNEKFYNLLWLPHLKFRASYGHSGNYSRQATAVAAIQYSNVNILGLDIPQASISNPPNKDLRWEQNRQLNFGLDFGLKNNRLSGTIEFYKKQNKDLMAQAPIDPTSGLTPINGGPSYFYGNVASTKGQGIDIQINSTNIDKVIKWQSTFLLSYSKIKVSEYYLPAPTSSQEFILLSNAITPIVDKPLFAMYSYQWAGLDPETGDPRGFLGKNISKDYGSIITKTSIDSLKYHGLVQPPLFGAFRNSFIWKELTLSFNISYKLNYYFRKSTIDYNTLYSSWTGHIDYAKRWQNPGDESNTNVPSRQYISYPQFYLRQSFYSMSSALIEKGDHVRLEDISASYSFTKTRFSKLPFNQVRIYAYISNLNLLIWKANNAGVDPYFINGRTTGVRTALGLNVTF